MVSQEKKAGTFFIASNTRNSTIGRHFKYPADIAGRAAATGATTAWIS